MTNEEVENAFASSSEMVCIMEFGKNFKRLNNKWKEVLGWEIQELLEAPYMKFVHPEDIQKTIEYEHAFIPAGFINRYRCKDGSYRSLSWVSLASKYSLGHNSFSIVHDVTLDEFLKNESKQQIKLLNEQIQFKNKLIEAIKNIQNYLDKLGSYGDELNINESFQHIIQHFINITDSELGFIGEVCYRQGEKTIGYHAWEPHSDFNSSKEAQNFFNNCKRIDLKECVFKHFLKEVFLTNKILILNDIGNTLVTAEIGEIPSALRSFLGIPLMIKNEVVGVIGLANRNNGYHENFTEWLSPLFLISAHIVNGVKMEHYNKELTYQKQEREKANIANVAKSDFLAHMSHEIRTPLGGVIGLLDLIEVDALKEESQQYLTDAKDAAHSLLTIVNDILDLSKIESGLLKFEEIEFNPLIIAQDVMKTLRSQAEKKGIRLKLEINPRLPNRVLGDPTRLKQIFTNLVGNAIKFTAKGKVSFKLDGESISSNINNNASDKDKIELLGQVHDTGIGMTPKTVLNLFSPFIQADSSTMRQFGGTGLGLYITKQLCEAMGGKINAFSKPDLGSTFEFKIPLCLPSSTLPSPISSNTAFSEAVLQSKLRDLRILVAEDNKFNQIILKTILTKTGCKVDIVQNGLEALNAVQTEHYHMVLMDGEMPIMNGLEATRQIRHFFNKDALPIIGITAHAMLDDRKKFLETGMNGYLTKPIDKDSLIKEIFICLGEKEPITKAARLE